MKKFIFGFIAICLLLNSYGNNDKPNQVIDPPPTPMAEITYNGLINDGVTAPIPNILGYQSEGVFDGEGYGNKSYFQKYFDPSLNSYATNSAGTFLALETEGETYDFDFTVNNDFVEGSFAGKTLDETLKGERIPVSGVFVAEIIKTPTYCD